ncbi:MAG: hypothetical protein ABI776_03945 [Nocardioidaceae bacterium]
MTPWITAGLVAWLALAILVSLLIARVIHRADLVLAHPPVARASFGYDTDQARRSVVG